jgi:HSP20 family protein
MLPVLRNGAFGSTQSGNRLANLFEHFFNEPFFTPASGERWNGLPLAFWQDENNLFVEVDLPGVAENDIEVLIHDGVLYIRGERKCDTRRYGQFEQRLNLPTAVDSDKVHAKLTNGTLKLTLPKSPEAKPRKIAIRGE